MTQALKRFLLSPDLPLWKYCLIAFPVAMIPSIAFAAIAHFTFLLLGINADLLSPPDTAVTVKEVFGVVLVSPVGETFLLAAMLAILSALSARAAFVAFAAAMVWGAFHAAFGVMWFFGTAWSFFVFSCAYLHWRKLSFGKAFLAASVPHALINSAVMLCLALFPGK
jgi:hypothetical protein